MKLSLIKVSGTLMIFVLINLSVNAQQTVTISGNDISDVMLYRNLRPGYEYTPNTNYGNHPRLAAVAWTASGYNSFMRSLLSFNLSSIPSGAVVQSATLYLYSDPTITGSGDANGNSQLSGSNAIYLEKVTGGWSESTVTWNSQPATTTTDRVWVGPSTSTTENLQINLTTLVQGWVNAPQSNYGLKMRLENEVRYRSRNYASKNHSNTAIRPKLVVTYTATPPIHNDPFHQQMDYIFANVNRSPVTTGLLEDYGLRLTDVNKFNGSLQSNNLVNRTVFNAIYSSLNSMRFNQNISMAALASVNTTINGYSGTSGGLPINNIIALNYNYEQFKTNALSSNLVYVSNGQIYDTPNRPTTPYEVKTVFAMSPVSDNLHGNDHIFRFRNELFFRNVNKTVSSVQIDFNDGLGYRTITIGSDIPVTYSTAGQKNILFKLTYTDGQILQSKSVVNVTGLGPSCSNCRYGAPTREPFTTAMGTADAWIFLGHNNATLDRPVILVEGFDPLNGYNEIAFNNGNFLNVLVNGLPLEDRLDAQHDLVFINFGNGGAAIEQNAALVEEVIEWVNQEKAAAGSTHRNIVVGASMGCLVARYALREMEIRGVNHETSLYVSVDGPHRGANVPLGFQAAVRYLAGADLFGNNFIDIVPELQDAMIGLGAPAATQMLMYQLTGTGGITQINNAAFTNFMNQYHNNIGMPNMWGIRNIAIASGSECGIGQGFGPYTQMMAANENVDIGYAINLLVSFIQTFYSIDRSSIFFNPFRFLEGLFTTNSDLRVTIDVRALPDRAAQRIFHLNLSYRKEILFGAITSTDNILNFSLNSTANMFSVDNSGGGWFNVNEFGTIPANISFIQLNQLQPTFDFIPTPSALCIGAGNYQLTAADLTAPYSPAQPPTGASAVPFNNFFANPIDNEFHTFLHTDNATWLWDEISGIPGTFSCAYACTGTPTAPVIDGPATVCGNATYTLLNAADASSFNWTHSGNLTPVGNTTSSALAVSTNANGSGFVSVVAGGDCGNAPPVIKNVQVGGEAADFTISAYPDCASPGETVTFVAEITNVNYDWDVNGGTLLGGQGTQSIYAQMTSQTMAVHCYVTGTSAANCYSPSGISSIYIDACSGFNAVSASPNPSTNAFTVEISEPLGEKEQVQVEIRDNFGIVKNEIAYGNKFEINTRNIRGGMYFVRVRYRDRLYTQTIIVEN